jgi:hypothetical protein
MTERAAGRPEKRDTCTVRTYAPPEPWPIMLTPPTHRNRCGTDSRASQPRYHPPPAIHPDDPPDASSLTSDCSWGGIAPTTTAHPATATSHCSWGGMGVLCHKRGTTPPTGNQDHELRGPTTTMDDTPPAASLTSSCSWDGFRVQ